MVRKKKIRKSFSVRIEESKFEDPSLGYNLRIGITTNNPLYTSFTESISLDELRQIRKTISNYIKQTKHER